MKKWISILCIALLLCSAMTLAVSAAAGTPEDPVVCTGLNFNMVKIPAGETYYISFTDTTGAAKRQISINSTTDKAAGFVLTYGETTQNSDADGYCNLVAAPDESGTYLLSITNNSAKQATFFISYYDIAPYQISDTLLYIGETAVTTLNADTSLFVFEPEETGVYEVLVDKENATLSYWNGSPAFVSGLAEEAVDGKLEVTCISIGQSLLIGLGNVDAANITITKVGEYIPPEAIVYEEYANVHTPVNNFQLPVGELTAIDITVAQTVVLGADGIYRYGSANGPVVYVDMTGVPFADLYECFYPATAGAQVADRLRGTYVDEDGKKCGYDFITAMRAYADALDSEGYYYLTEDLANYIKMYGGDQGWFNPDFSPFETIKNGTFIEESAWLLTAYYVPGTGGEDPILPGEPDEPNEPSEPDTPNEPNTPNEPDAPVGGDKEPESPATGDVTSFGALAALLLSSAGALSFCKKRY